MRDELKKIKGYNRFSAYLSVKKSPSGIYNYILLNLKLYGKYKTITDHLWITDLKNIEIFNEFVEEKQVKNNSLITFTAKKCEYHKGYYGNQIVVRRKTRDVGLTDYKNIRFEKGDENEKYIKEIFQSVDEDIENLIFNKNSEVTNLNSNTNSNKNEQRKPKFKFFLSGFESNWYRCQFKDDEGHIFNCTEQYFMYNKAILFGDEITAREILKTVQPRFQKSLGRKVRGFKEDIWNENKERIMYEGNLLKYKQNKRLKKLLIDTYPDILVEANPDDKIWGIGISEDSPLIKDKSKWGQNLMGKTLMKVREELMK